MRTMKLSDNSLEVYDVDLSKSKCFNPYNRFVALLFIALATFFYGVIYIMPRALQYHAISKFCIDSYEYESLNSVYTLPNVIMCFFSGMLMDRALGLAWGSLLFSLIALAGQAIVTASGFSNYFYLMLIGRFVSGIGLESASLSLCSYSVIWFEANELSFVFGLLTSVCRLGTTLTSLTFDSIYHYLVVNFPFSSFGISTLIFLLAAAALLLLLAFLCYYSTHRIKRYTSFKLDDNQPSLQDVLYFPLIFWLILIMISVCNNAIFAFLSISRELLKIKYNLTNEGAKNLSRTFYLMSAFVCPVFGFAADKMGADLYFNMFGMLLGITSQLIISLTNWNPIIPLTLYAVFYGILNSCAWPLVARVVKPCQVSTAYGIHQCFINLIGAVNTVLAGYFLDFFGPNGVSSLFLGNILVGLLFCIVVFFIDRRSCQILNMSAYQRRKLLKINKPG